MEYVHILKMKLNLFSAVVESIEIQIITGTKWQQLIYILKNYFQSDY